MSPTMPINFIAFQATSNHLYGLTANGDIWYRSTLPYSTTTYAGTYSTVSSRKEEEKKEEEALWKPLSMKARVPEGVHPAKEVSQKDDDVDCTDPDTIKALQGRLNVLNLNCGIPDGVLGVKTVAAIKDFQKALNLEPSGILTVELITLIYDGSPREKIEAKKEPISDRSPYILG